MDLGADIFLLSLLFALAKNRWVNRKDTEGNNVFEGGFLGLDNIGLFNRSEPMPNGATLRQADGTSWMAFFSLCMYVCGATNASETKRREDDFALGLSQR